MCRWRRCRSRDKAQENPNAVLDVDDVVAFERRHGRIPRGAAVFMDSGWAERWEDGDLAYRGTATLEEFPFNFPGFSAEACEFLIERREIVGVVNDVRVNGLQDDSRLQVYLPYGQTPQPYGSFVVRAGGDAVTLRRGLVALLGPLLELPAGTLELSGTQVGHRIEFQEKKGDHRR